jgi:hypothetical protein
MKDKIRKNLIIKVDYEREKTLSGIFLNKHTFYIIGVILVAITYATGETVITKPMARESIPLNDPKLRNILGVKATDLIRVKKYETEITSIILKLEKELKQIMQRKTFQNKPIKDLKIVVIE